MDKVNISRRDFLKLSLSAAAVGCLPLLSCENKTTQPETAYLSFELEFNRAMNRQSVEDAITINPAVTGFFDTQAEWNAESTRVLFKGNTPDTKTVYSVTLEGSAADEAGNYLDGNQDGTGGDAYSFTINAVNTPW